MNVALGVGGGIAAYKAAELTRELMERGFGVQVIMTAAAQEFVRPLTFASLTGRKVITDLFGPSGAPQSSEATLSSAIEHIQVAQDNDVLVMAPATADLLAKLAHGFAGDFLTTVYLAFTGPVLIAPAMNANMWGHPATQENLRLLRARGHSIVEPAEGFLACGMIGPGRLAEPIRIAEAVAALHMKPAPKRDLEGEIVLITAGPTQEPLDAVRYISNRSSGKMGYALAEAAIRRGAKVILVSGPTALTPPSAAETIFVETAQQMRTAVLDRWERAGIIIMAAAVGDYHVKNGATEKIKRGGPIELQLEPNPDILAGGGVRERFVNRFIGILQIDVLPDHRNGYLFARTNYSVDEPAPVRQVRLRCL